MLLDIQLYINSISPYRNIYKIVLYIDEILMYGYWYTNHDNTNINTCIRKIQSHIDNIHLTITYTIR